MMQDQHGLTILKEYILVMNHTLQSLNSAQHEAVTLPVGPSLIWVGPGSGKPHVLTQHIAYLLHELGVSQETMVAITFTNRAANAMNGLDGDRTTMPAS